MTSLGFPGLSSRSVSGLFGPSWPENPKTDWDDKPGLPKVAIQVRFGFFWPFSARINPKRTGMTSLGFPGLPSQSVSRAFGHFWPEHPETDWDDKTGFPRDVIPVCFGFLLALFGKKTPKRIGMTSLGFSGLSSQSISGFFVPFRPEKPETDWDDKPGLPTVVNPVRFGVCWPFSARKPRNGLLFSARRPRNRLG